MAYGTSKSPLGPIEVAKDPIVLIQDPQHEIYGTAHNSVIQKSGTDEHEAVTPIEVRLLRYRVDEDIHIDELTVATRMVLRQERMAQVNKWTRRRISNCYTHLLSAVIIRTGAEIEIVLVAAVLLLHLYE